MASRLLSRKTLILAILMSVNVSANTPKSLGSVIGSPTRRHDVQFGQGLPAKERAALWLSSFEKTNSPLDLRDLSNDLLKMILAGGDKDREAALHIYALHLAERARPSQQIDPESLRRVRKLNSPRPGLQDFLESILARIQEKTGKNWKTFSKAVTEDAMTIGLDKETLQSFGKIGSIEATAQALYIANERRAVELLKISPIEATQKFSALIQDSPLIQQMVRVYQSELEQLMANPLTNGILTEEVTPRK